MHRNCPFGDVIQYLYLKAVDGDIPGYIWNFPSSPCQILASLYIFVTASLASSCSSNTKF
jgi:hypothetical protein